MPVQKRIKRKYYKRCLNQYAWRFAPTGALQPGDKFLLKRGFYISGKDEPEQMIFWSGDLPAPSYFTSRIVTEPLEFKENEREI